MNIRLLVLVAALPLAGCLEAQMQSWLLGYSKPGASEAELRAASAQCKFEVAKAVPGGTLAIGDANLTFLSALADGGTTINEGYIYTACMKAKGWEKASP
jgi:hypothetical protein